MVRRRRRYRTRLAEKALSEAGDDLELQAPIRAELVRLSFSWDLRSALEHADRAIELLSDERRPTLLAHVLVDRLFGSALRGEAVSKDLLTRALSLEESHRRVDTEPPQPMPLLWFHCTDDVEAARARFAVEERWYRERGEEVWLADRLSHVAVAELHAGNWDLAERQVEDSCRAVEQLSLSGPRAMVFEKRALVDGHRGRTERARNTLEGLVTDFEDGNQGWWAALTLSTLGFVEFAAGDGPAADAALVRMRALAETVGADDVLFDRSEPFHIEVLLELGELDRARATLARLEQRGERLPRPWISAALPRARALVAAESGDVQGALEHLQDKESDTTEALPFELAQTLLVRGRLERRARHKRAASESLGRALTLFGQLGAPDFVARTQGELARVGLHRTGPGLTPTELLVARHAASGMTNREIAQAAFISEKTVESNLAKVYRKLGIRSRAELGARMPADEREQAPQT